VLEERIRRHLLYSGFCSVGVKFLQTFDETFDVGMDTRTGVDDMDYQPPFRFKGKIDRLA